MTCPECGRSAPLEEWDVMLADPGNAFCPYCVAEVPVIPDDFKDLPLFSSTEDDHA